jgi:enoyl-CoA hydratase
MSYEYLIYETRQNLAFLTINRPKVLNALNDATLDELRHVFLQIRQDDMVRAVIITGAGEKAFIAGADINEIAQQGPNDAMQRSTRGQHVFHLIETLGKPVIAAINGFALGGGCELALACTIRVASTNAKLGQPEVKLGLIPGYGGTQRLARLVGKGLALELLLTGEMIDAQEAFRIGLVNRIVPSEQLISTAEELARKMISNAPLALQYCMEAVHHGMEVGEKEGLFIEATLFGMACATDDMREGTRAFLGKRSPCFTGH